MPVMNTVGIPHIFLLVILSIILLFILIPTVCVWIRFGFKAIAEFWETFFSEDL